MSLFLAQFFHLYFSWRDYVLFDRSDQLFQGLVLVWVLDDWRLLCSKFIQSQFSRYRWLLSRRRDYADVRGAVSSTSIARRFSPKNFTLASAGAMTFSASAASRSSSPS